MTATFAGDITRNAGPPFCGQFTVGSMFVGFTPAAGNRVDAQVTVGQAVSGSTASSTSHDRGLLPLIPRSP